MLTVASKGPGLLFSAYGGELADRFDRRRLVAVSSAIQAMLAALLAVLAWEGTGSVLRRAATLAVADPRLRGLLGVALAFSLIVAPIQEMAPAIAKAHGNGAQLLGFMLAALAAGGLIGNWLRSRVQDQLSDRLLLGGSLVFAAIPLALLGAACEAGVSVLGSGGDYAIALTSMLLLGVAWDVLYVMTLSGVQLHRRELAGVMTGLFYTVILGGLTLGAVALGGVIDAVEIGGGLLLSAALLALAAVHFLRSGVGGTETPA